MAMNRATQYPNRWNTPDANSPQGSGKNRTAPGSNDGSYFEKVMWDDMDSLNQALFIASGIAINGTPDTGTASQHFDALVNNRWSVIGNYHVGTIVTASNGKQYKAVANSGRDTSAVNPETAPDRSVWVEYPYVDGSNQNGEYRIYHDNTIEQWGSSSTGTGTVTQDYPIPFASNVTHVGVGHTSNPSSGIEYIQIINKSNLDSFTAVGYVDIASSATVGNVNFTFYAKGI